MSEALSGTLETVPASVAEPSLTAPAEFAGVRDRYPRERVIHLVRRLSRVSNLRSALLIAANWGVICGAFALAVWSGHWAVYIAAAIVIGLRQYALGILMHEGAHYLLFTNRTANDIASDLFCAFPVGQCTTLYRESHFRHHWYTSSDRDPDWQDLQEDEDMWRWPKTRGRLLWVVLKCVLGLNLLQGYKYFRRNNPALNLWTPISPAYPLRSRVLYVASSVVSLVAVIWAGLLVPVLVLYALPSVTLLNFIIRFRTIAEHLQTEGQQEINAARTVEPTWLERLMIAPHGVNYHIEHHLFPSVPGPNLARLHQVMLADEQYRAGAHLTQSYSGFVRELLGRR